MKWFNNLKIKTKLLSGFTLIALLAVAVGYIGIINIRGQILSVIDIKKFFDLPDKGLGDLNKVIILHSDKPALSKVEGMEFGILADVILSTRLIPLNEVQPSLPTLTGTSAEYLKGVAKDRMVILDGDKLLSDKRIVVHEEADI